MVRGRTHKQSEQGLALKGGILGRAGTEMFLEAVLSHLCCCRELGAGRGGHTWIKSIPTQRNTAGNLWGADCAPFLQKETQVCSFLRISSHPWVPD